MIQHEKVLVVDGDPGVRAAVALGLMNFEVWGASDGRTALRYVKTIPFAHVIMDCELPDMSVGEVVAGAVEARPETDVLLTSGEENLTRIAEGFRAGARSFLRKPFGSAELKAAIRKDPRVGMRVLNTLAEVLADEGYPLEQAIQFVSQEMHDLVLRKRLVPQPI